MEKFISKYIGTKSTRLAYRRDLKIAFDCDLTLIDEHDRPIYENINLLLWFVDRGYSVIVWSGGGSDGEGSYAHMHCRKLGIDELVRIIPKGSEKVDIAFDDEQVALGQVNVVV